jgi:hypothetical protein
MPDINEEERDWLQHFERTPTEAAAEDMARRAPLGLMGGDVGFALLPYCMLSPSNSLNEIGLGASWIGLCEIRLAAGRLVSRSPLVAAIERLATRDQLRTICLYVKFHGQYFSEPAAASWLGYWSDVYDGTYIN